MVAVGWCRPEEQEVISLRLFEDRSHEETAAELGVSVVAVRQRFSRAVRRVSEAMGLQALMTRRGFPLQKQDVIGIHRFQGVDSAMIAARLQLQERRVTLWIAEAELLFRELDQNKP